MPRFVSWGIWGLKRGLGLGDHSAQRPARSLPLPILPTRVVAPVKVFTV